MIEPPARPRPTGGRAASRSHDGPSDEQLVVALVARRPEAVDLLYARYGRPAYALARRITGDDGFAEDVVQEVFLTLWREPSKFDRARGGFASWLLSVTHHKAVDAVRREEAVRRRRAQAAGEAIVDADDRAAGRPSVDEQVWSLVRRAQVRDALRDLPPAQRQALALAYFGGYTQREVAALTSAPLGTVKTRMLAGMRRLAKVLRDPVSADDPVSAEEDAR
ncbi:MAG TPA: sigma-70 family RNA polymerase sigma factor [Cryptosporangiaceae bacterium]|nr:sigma-70 family RNA polymerase sigma factor [Cryptosporangiaceae bacterium]